MWKIFQKFEFSYLSGLVLLMGWQTWQLSQSENWPLIAPILAVLYLFWHAYGYAQINAYLKKQNTTWLDYLMYPLSLFVAGGTFYYFFDLKNQNLTLFLHLLSLPILIFFTKKLYEKDIERPTEPSLLANTWQSLKTYLAAYKINKNSIFDYLSAGIYLLSLAILLLGAYHARTGEAIRSFWQLLPKYWLLLYFLSSAWLIIMNFYRRHVGWKLLNILHLNFTLALAFIIYRFGYGFDPFIHQATEQAIFTDGLINPKQPYYAGYYAVTVILAKLFHSLPAFWDKLMIFLAFNGVMLPLFNHWLKKLNPQNYGWLYLLFFLIPFSLFISPTPQAIANLFSLGLLFALLAGNVHWLNQAGLVATILLIHPLSGIPIFFFWLFWISKNKIWRIINFSALGVALPAIFFLQGKLNGLTVWSGDWQKISEFFKGLIGEWPLRYQIWKDSAYAVISQLPLLGVIIGGLLVWKRKSFEQWTDLKKLFDGIFALLICYLLTLQLTFPALIYYEQNDYSQRILYLIMYLFLALVIVAINKFFSINQKKIYYLPLLVALAGLITINVYQSYPRDDQYHLDRGYNTAAADFSAVKYIQENAGEATNNESTTERESKTPAAAPATFVVLAPQSVGAAALNLYGFYHQIENVAGEKLYYYSIPTGGELYQHYLKIVYEDQSREYLQIIFNDYQVEQLYIVIPRYWHNSENIINNLKNSTDDWVELDGERIFVFILNR